MPYDVAMAIDPGAKNIGIAIRMGGIYTTTKGVVPADLYRFFHTTIDVVIIERFDTDWINRYGLDTVEMVGGVKALCYLKDIPVVIHTPQYRKAFMDPARIKLREILLRDGRKGIDNHEHDALAHLLAWETLQEGKFEDA